MDQVERRRKRQEENRRVVHYCDCGMKVLGSPGWWSHKRSNPDHAEVTEAVWQEGRSE